MEVEVTRLPVIQYAKLRDLYPQKVYAAIRAGKLEQRLCDCGRKVVIIAEADTYFGLEVNNAGQVSDSEPLHQSEPSGDDHPQD